MRRNQAAARIELQWHLVTSVFHHDPAGAFAFGFVFTRDAARVLTGQYVHNWNLRPLRRA